MKKKHFTLKTRENQLTSQKCIIYFFSFVQQDGKNTFKIENQKNQLTPKRRLLNINNTTGTFSLRLRQIVSEFQFERNT